MAPIYLQTTFYDYMTRKFHGCLRQDGAHTRSIIYEE